jgi:hypothetical protein
MIPRGLLIATGIIVSVGVIACDGDGSTSPTAPRTLSAITANQTQSRSAASPRTGALYVTKECSTYTGHAADICTITSSNVDQIEVGSRVVYARAAAWPLLDTDVVLDPPGPGNNTAFGHCALNLETGVGVCTFSGGTGKFTHFQANVAVSNVGGPNYAWEGTYSFSPTGD